MSYAYTNESKLNRVRMCALWVVLPQAKVELARAQKNSNSDQLEVPRGEPWLDQLGAPIKRHLNLEERQLFVISGLGPANG